MHPILLVIGSYSLSSWHFFYFLGSIAAWFSLRFFWKNFHFENIESLDVLFFANYLGAYFGARLLSIVLEAEYRDENFRLIEGMFSFGSMTLYGGILSGIIVSMLLAFFYRIEIMQLADALCPSAMLGVAFGRIGCFLNGDDYGSPVMNQISPPPWAVVFPNLEDEVYRFPVQLFEALLCLFLWGVCCYLSKYFSLKKGIASTFCIVGYCIGRFILEFYRGDDRGPFLLNLFSPAQIVSMLLLTIWAIYLKKKISQSQLTGPPRL